MTVTTTAAEREAERTLFAVTQESISRAHLAAFRERQAFYALTGRLIDDDGCIVHPTPEKREEGRR